MVFPAMQTTVILIAIANTVGSASTKCQTLHKRGGWVKFTDTLLRLNQVIFIINYEATLITTNIEDFYYR